MPVGAGIRAVVDVAAAEQGIVLAVRSKDLAEAAALGHRLAHHALGLHAASVVGKGDDVWRHARKVCELLALFADRDRPVGVNMDERVLLDERALKIQRVDTVGDGVQVRHSGNVGEAAVRGSQRAGADGLFIRKSRLSKMNMNINETGKQNHIGNINSNSIIGTENTIANRNNFPVRKKHIRQMKYALRENLCVLQNTAHVPSSLSCFRCIIRDNPANVKSQNFEKKREREKDEKVCTFGMTACKTRCFAAGKGRKGEASLGVKCSIPANRSRKKTVLFDEIPGSARKCKIMRLTIGAEALILMAMKFHERRITAMKSIFVFAYYYYFTMNS